MVVLSDFSIPVIGYPLFLSDLVPCELYLSFKVKFAFIGTRFKSAGAVKGTAAWLLKELTKGDNNLAFYKNQIRNCVASNSLLYSQNVYNLF